MKTNSDEIKNEEIYKKYIAIINTIYTQYHYLGITKSEYTKIVEKAIENSKNENTGEISFSIYLKEKISDELMRYTRNLLSDNETAPIVLDSFIKNHFSELKSNAYVTYNLKKLIEFFACINYIPNPDILIDLMKRNTTLSKTICLFIKNNLEDIKHEAFDDTNDILSLLIETYLQINNIEVANIEKENYNFFQDDTSYSTDQVRNYFNEIAGMPPLTKTEEKYYAEEILRGNEYARNCLIEGNLKLVVIIAKKYVGLGIPYSDLIQEGNFGLTKAADLFDISKGCHFTTYATWWIKQAILSALEVDYRFIRVPIESHYKLIKYNNAIKELFKEKGVVPTDKEVAKYLNISTNELSKIKKYNFQIDSLNSLVNNDEEKEFSELIASTEDSLDEIVERRILSKEIQELFKKSGLSDREITIMTLHFGLDGNNPYTLEEIGNIMGGVTRKRIGQIVARAFKKIRMSSDIKNFSIYMSNPDEAIKNIMQYRKNYSESDLNTYRMNVGTKKYKKQIKE